MELSREQIRIIKNSVVYTVRKYVNCIDFSKLPTLEARYLLKNIMTLNEFYSEKRK